MQMSLNKRYLTLYCLGLLFAIPNTYAAGYKIEFQSASVLADSGDAAVVEDVGTNWYNSAGLVLLPQQIAASGIALYKPTNFGGTVFAPSPTGDNFFGNGGSSSYLKAFLPGFHYGVPFNLFNNCFAFGLSVVPAWGLLEEYGGQALLRYDLERVYTRTLEVEPSVAWKINNQWSVGIGPDFHYFALQLKNRARTQAITASDSISRVSVDKWGYGGHIGVLFRLSDCTRFGLNYRSKINMDLDGFSDFTLTGIAAFSTNQFRIAIPLPPVTTFSFYHEVNPCWAIMGTIAYDQWTVIRDLHGINYIRPPTQANPTGLVDVVFGTGYKNTFDFALGTHYKFSEKILGRFSIKYEQTPTSTKFRDVSFPDGEKLGINFGARYQINKCLAVDALYAHVFVRTVNINITEPLTFVTVNGHSRDSADIFGAQIVWNI